GGPPPGVAPGHGASASPRPPAAAATGPDPPDDVLAPASAGGASEVTVRAATSLGAYTAPSRAVERGGPQRRAGGGVALAGGVPGPEQVGRGRRARLAGPDGVADGVAGLVAGLLNPVLVEGPGLPGGLLHAAHA